MNTLIPLLIATAIIALVSGSAIWIVGRLGLGLQVDTFGTALLAAVVIAVVAGAITILFSLAGIGDDAGLIGGIIHLVIAALALMVGARFLSGLRITGFYGALVAAAAIGAVYWLGGLLLGALI